MYLLEYIMGIKSGIMRKEIFNKELIEKYRDENGLWVIGSGHANHEEDNFHGGITPLQAECLLQEDIQLCERLLRENITRPLTQQQHDALVVLIFSFAETPSRLNALYQAIARV